MAKPKQTGKAVSLQHWSFCSITIVRGIGDPRRKTTPSREVYFRPSPGDPGSLLAAARALRLPPAVLALPRQSQSQSGRLEPLPTLRHGTARCMPLPGLGWQVPPRLPESLGHQHSPELPGPAQSGPQQPRRLALPQQYPSWADILLLGV